MNHRIRNIIIAICIGVIALSVAAGLNLFLELDYLDAGMIAAIGFCVLLVLHNNLVLQRQLSRVERYFLDIRKFEQDVIERIKQLESGVGPKVPEMDESIDNTDIPGRNPGDRNAPLAQIGKATEMLSDIADPKENQSGSNSNKAIGIQGNSGAAPDNIIALNGRLKRNEKPASAVPFKIKPSQLTHALENDGAELFLQPILELPTRNVLYFEAFVRLRLGDNILTAKQFLPAAKDSGQIALIDLLSLELTFNLVRGLMRQESEHPVFWNIAPQSLGNKKVFKDILEQLRANQPLNRQLICEISHSTFRKLNTVQSDNLARIRDLGYEMSVDNIESGFLDESGVDGIFESGLYKYLKVPALELMRIGGEDITNFANYVVPLAANNDISLIASEVESEAQTVSMIDAEVYLAQGNALMPARALKKELGGA